MPSRLFQTASGDILMNADNTNSRQPGSEPDAPPRGSALHVETALTYARRASNQAEMTAYADDKQMRAIRDSITVVIEQLEEVSAKIKKQWQTAP